MAASPLCSWRPRRGRYCYVTIAFLGVPNAKGGEKIRSGYIIPAFLGDQKRAELLRDPRSPGGGGVRNAKCGEKIRSGCLTLAFSRAPKRAELLCNPCIVGSPLRQSQGKNQKWLPHPSTIGGQEEDGIAQ